MDIKHLRIFAATVEEGSIQAASRLLNIAQPALSRRIMDLEAELGCALLVRGGRGVTPTQAGLALYRDALAILESVTLAAQRAQRLGLEQDREVRFGLVLTSRRYAFLHEALAGTQKDGSSVGVALNRALSRDNATALRNGELDASLLFERRVGQNGFGERLIHKERYVLAVHPAHPLATSGPVRLAELAGRPLVFVQREDLIDRQSPLLAHCRLHGLEPIVGQWAKTPDEMFDLVAASGGMCLTPASAIITTPPGFLAFRLVEDLPLTLDLHLAWADPPGTKAARAFLDRLHLAINRHREMIVADAAPWCRLDGARLYSTH